jgi:hypothetical protein
MHLETKYRWSLYDGGLATSYSLAQGCWSACIHSLKYLMLLLLDEQLLGHDQKRGWNAQTIFSFSVWTHGMTAAGMLHDITLIQTVRDKR